MRKRKMSIMHQAKAKLGKMLKLEFATVTTDDGITLYIDGDGVEGDSVFEVNENGEYVSVADGSYVAGGRTYVVSNGTITEVIVDENFQEAETIDEAPEVEGEIVTAEEVNDVVEVVNEILEVVKEQDEEIQQLAEEVVMLEAELKRATGRSNAKPATTNKFNKDAKVGRFAFADQKMQNLIKNFK